MRLNPLLRAAQLEIEASDGAVQQSSTLPNPTLAIEQEDAGRQTRSTTVQINQALEIGGQRSARMALARRDFDLATSERDTLRADVRASTILAFFEALVAQERVKVADESARIAASGSSAAARRVTAGKVSPTEETRAQVAEAHARIELRRAQVQQTAAMRELALVMGVSVGELSPLDGRPEALPPLPAADALAQRLASSPALRRAELAAQRAQSAYELERARAVPDITVSLGAKRSPDVERNQVVVGLSIPLPLFDRNQGAQLEALRRRDAAQAKAEAQAQKLRAQALQAADELQLRTSEVQALQQEVLPGARSAYEAASRGFELGKFSFIDVLDAQRTWLQARSQHLEALSQAHRAAAELERHLGTTTDGPSLGIQH
jgi:cobalt-zinc-cadmium efflux system outer membrane protein